MKTSGETNEPFLKKTAQTDDQTGRQTDSR